MFFYRKEENEIAFLQVQASRKNKKKKERERRTADERSRAILRLRRWHSVTKASAELSTNRDEDFRGIGSTRLSRVGAHCFGSDVDYAWVATPQCRVLSPCLMAFLHAKDMGGLIILYVSPQLLKCGPFTTSTRCVTVAVL